MIVNVFYSFLATFEDLIKVRIRLGLGSGLVVELELGELRSTSIAE